MRDMSQVRMSSPRDNVNKAEQLLLLRKEAANVSVFGRLGVPSIFASSTTTHSSFFPLGLLYASLASTVQLVIER